MWCAYDQHTKRAGAYCLGLLQNEDSSTILGGIVTRSMLVTYDREKDQIGLSEPSARICGGTCLLLEHSRHQITTRPFLLSPGVTQGGSILRCRTFRLLVTLAAFLLTKIILEFTGEITQKQVTWIRRKVFTFQMLPHSPFCCTYRSWRVP